MYIIFIVNMYIIFFIFILLFIIIKLWIPTINLKSSVNYDIILLFLHLNFLGYSNYIL
jgi:hypothetical protein